LAKNIPALVLSIASPIILLFTGSIDPAPAGAGEIPRAKCIAEQGDIKCGYNCITEYGKIQCGEWPGAACKAEFGKIVCGPPAPTNWLSFYRRRDRKPEDAKAKCLADRGDIQCGYNCIADNGNIQCGEWPGAACKAEYGKIVCGPPAPTNWLEFF
jgi:hypothetical protein